MKDITWAKITWYFMLGMALSYVLVSGALAGGLGTHHYNGFDDGGPPSYLKYKIPGTDVPCCNASDCKEATKWYFDKKTGDYMIWIDERNVYYRAERRRIIFDNVSKLHICYDLNGTERGYQVRCIIVPIGVG